jgi:membrane protein implicated in regulation of membrane protease activity
MGFLLVFPVVVLVVGPFVFTYIASEPSSWPHTPDIPLALGVEAAWLVFLLVTVNLVAAIHKAVRKDKEHAQRVAVSDERQTGALVEVLQALEKAGDRGVPSRRVAPAAAACLLERGYMRKESGRMYATQAGLQALRRWEGPGGTWLQ